MSYLFQLKTSDFGLQLKTEVVANSVAMLKVECKKMIKKHKKVIGQTFRIFSVEKVNGSFKSLFLKEGIVLGS